ncbi:hypothetical protein KM043_004896 [Ampulex compressa]|nr:hypothetical protein KM043_004896 [Ampulex compressa]
MANTTKHNALKENKIVTELFDDSLSDIPSDEDDSDEDDTESESGYSDIIRLTRKSKTVIFSSDSESDAECNFHDGSINDFSTQRDADSWSEMDAPPRLEKFQGTPGVTVTISEPDKVAARVEHVPRSNCQEIQNIA